MSNSLNPFFSVIIPCHNSRNTIERLLNSIVNQHFDDMEIIIQDDFSTDGFMELVKPFEELLNIKYFKNKPRDIHCPGNTRIDGLSHARGQWIAFIDHDDMFEPDVFEEVKACIEYNKEKYLVVSNFREYRPELNAYTYQYDKQATFWLHGKFYNRQFLLDYKINFKENLVSHEDHYFNQLVFGYLGIMHIAYSILKMNTYIWFYDDNSTGKKMCRITENGFCFIDNYYEDYVLSVSEPLFMLYEKYPEMKDTILAKMTYIALYAYFYYQSLYYRNDLQDYMPNKEIFGIYIKKIKDNLNVTNQDIIDQVYADSETYNNMRDTVHGTCGQIIERKSFYDFVNEF